MSNQLLRERLQAFGEEHQMEVLIPPLACVWKRGVRRRECTDNAVMIAWRGLQLWEAGRSIVPYKRWTPFGMKTGCRLKGCLFLLFSSYPLSISNSFPTHELLSNKHTSS